MMQASFCEIKNVVLALDDRSGLAAEKGQNDSAVLRNCRSEQLG